MHDPDLVFSLGPNCRNTWNLRHYFESDRAYPFDWWITPVKSMIALLDRDRPFHVAAEDLVVTTPEGGTNTVYNRRLNLLHHHDFDRDGNLVRPITAEAVAKLNTKYAALFARFWSDLDGAARPLAVMNGIYGGWGAGTPDGGRNPVLNGRLPPQDVFDAVRGRLGGRLRLLVVEVGEAARQDLEGGTVIRLPDPGIRLDLPKGQDYAEPIQVFRDAFAALGLAPGALRQAPGAVRQAPGAVRQAEDAAATLAISNNTPRVRRA
jgi:hypothetical protein